MKAFSNSAVGGRTLSGSEDRSFLGVRTGLVSLGEWLLYLCFILPFGVEAALSVVSLPMPAQAELFGTVWPYYSLLHVAALGVALGLSFWGNVEPILRNKPFVIYCVVNMLAILWMLVLRPSGVPLYWDYALEFLRLTSLVVLALLVVGARHDDPRILARSLILLLSIPVILLLFTNMSHFLSEREGRINAPGLEIGSTGHVSAIAVLLGLTLPVSRSLRVGLLLIGGVCLLQSGSRLALVFCILTVAMVLWKKNQGLKKRVLSVVGLVVAGVVIIWFGSVNATVGERLGTFGDAGGLRDELAGGRAMGLVASFLVIADHPLGYVDSDWAIQEELVSVGFPSHTHSNLLQSYLRFGPLSFLFWGVLVSQTVVGFKAKSPYAPALLFILMGSLFDYYGFVTKAMLIVFVLTGLNANHILQSRRGTDDSPARLGGSAELQEV